MTQACSASGLSVDLRDVTPDVQFRGVSRGIVSRITDRADEVAPGSWFAVIVGERFHGRHFVSQALANGAAGLLVDDWIDESPLPQALVPNVRRVYSDCLNRLHGEPSQPLQVIGVTGTNGKSTVAWMTRALLRHVGEPCGLLSTVLYDDGHHCEPAGLTTPDPATFWNWLSRMRDHGLTHAALELSSHALHQDRVAGLKLHAAIITNVTHDHLDYHGTWDAYWTSKARILEYLKPDGIAVINRDDPASTAMITRVRPGQSCLSIGLHAPAEIRASRLVQSARGTRFVLDSPWGRDEAYVPMPGLHNLHNALGVLAALLHEGFSQARLLQGLGSFPGVPGRLEPVRGGQPFDVFIDYAHTDDALSKCLSTLRPLTAGRLICVFGAGGDRDRFKRPKLGRAACLADEMYVTSDNPRTEAPAAIAAEVVAGMVNGRSPHVELDRNRAIEAAILSANPGDVVVIAGKGHEQEQVIGQIRRPFDDWAAARMAIVLWHQQHRTSWRKSA